jgi:outer membrane protein TolC
MTQLQFGVSQAFPFPGKLALKEQAAEYEAAAGLDNVYELRLRLKQQVTSSWWELYYIDRSLEVIDANLNLLRQFVKIAETKYKVGDGLQQDVLLAQLELSKLLEQEIQVKSLRENEVATLNTLMGENAYKHISLSASANKTLAAIPSVEALVAEANEKNPLLKKDENLISAAKSQLDLAEKEYYPDFKVGVNYGDRSGINPNGSRRDDFLSLMFNMSVPLYASSKQDKGVSQRQNELSQRKYSLQDTQNAISSRIVSLSSGYSKSRDLFTLFDTGIIPQAQQTVDSMLSGYRVSEVDFLNLVGSQITLLNYQLRYWRALSQGKQFLAKLDEITVGENPYE